MKTVVVLNPASRDAAAAQDALLRAAADLGLDAPDVWTTTPDSPGGPQARAAVAAGADTVVAVGGDGTVREVAGALAATGVPLGIVPAGTANLFARTLRLPRRRHRAAAVALLGTPRAVDARTVTTSHPGGRTSRHAFCTVAGVGQDAVTIADTDAAAKRRLGWVSYLASGTRHLADPPLPMTVTSDGRSEHLDTWCVLVGTAVRLPLGIRVFPGARLDDGLLHTLTLPLRSPWQWSAAALTALTGWRCPPLRYGTATEVTIIPDAPTLAHVDGDPIGEITALSATIRPGSLLVRTRPRQA